MKFIYLCTATLFLITSTQLFSQTKFIAHRSHSGLDETFTLTGEGNFGEISGSWYYIDTTFQVESVEESSKGTEQTPPVTPEPKAVPKEHPKISPPKAPPATLSPTSAPSPTRTPTPTPTIDTLNQSTPAVDSLQPTISSSEKGGEESLSSDQSISQNEGGENQNSLIWLALGLGVPAIVTVGRNLWKGTNNREV